MRRNLFSWGVLISTALSLGAQESADKKPVLSVSLDDCIHLVLQKNIALQIGRISPQIARWQLAGAYGYYDPLLSARASQNYNNRPGTLDPNVSPLPIPGSRQWNET